MRTGSSCEEQTGWLVAGCWRTDQKRRPGSVYRSRAKTRARVTIRIDRVSQRDTLGGMGVDQTDIEQATTLVARDLIATLGLPTETAEALARREAVAAAEIMNEWDDDDVSWPLFLARVVEETQQWLHDTFVDTTWPRCPEHANHPLWLNDDESAGWACAATNTMVCPVGQLGALVRGG